MCVCTWRWWNVIHIIPVPARWHLMLLNGVTLEWRGTSSLLPVRQEACKCRLESCGIACGNILSEVSLQGHTLGPVMSGAFLLHPHSHFFFWCWVPFRYLSLSLFLSLALPLFVLRLPFSEVSDAIPIAVEWMFYYFFPPLLSRLKESNWIKKKETKNRFSKYLEKYRSRYSIKANKCMGAKCNMLYKRPLV